MTYERFLEIREQNKDIYISDIQMYNCSFNKKVYRCRFSTKGTEEEEPYFRYLIHNFNFDGNCIYLDKDGIRNIMTFVRCEVFSDEEWKVILPHIFFEEFNREYDKLAMELAPMLGKIYRWKEDLHLEFWQGIFSFGSHWRTKGMTLRQSINSPKNGDLYCDTLIEMHPIIEKFLQKRDYDALFTLRRRLS